MKKEHLFPVLRILVGALFVYTGYVKLLEPPSQLAGVILSYRILTISSANLAANIIPWVELIAGVFFITGLYLRQAMFFLWFLNAIFAVAVAWVIFHKIPIKDCGCFGEAVKNWPIGGTLTLDLALFALFLAFFFSFQSLKHFSLDRRFEKNK